MPQAPILLLQLLDPEILIPCLILKPRPLHLELVHHLAMKQLQLPMQIVLQYVPQVVGVMVRIALLGHAPRVCLRVMRSVWEVRWCCRLGGGCMERDGRLRGSGGKVRGLGSISVGPAQGLSNGFANHSVRKGGRVHVVRDFWRRLCVDLEVVEDVKDTG